MNGAKILVAEDDPVFRRVIVFTLERHGFVVAAANNGMIAWELAQAHDFDGLVTDHQMPGLTGIELLERLRSTSKFTDKPIVLCTAKGLELDTSFLIERYGLASVLHKPFSPQRLASLLLEQTTPAGAAQ